MDFWDTLAGKPSQPAVGQPSLTTPASSGQPKPTNPASSDWLDAIIDRQGLGHKRDLVRSIYQQESSSGAVDTSKPNASGARGPLQVTEIAFKDMQQRGYVPKEYRWDNPQHSAEAGVAYLKHALKTHGDDDEKAAAFYFGGPDAIGKDGTIRRERMDANKKTIGAYVDEVKKRIAVGAPAARSTAAAAPAAAQIKSVPWEEVTADPAYAELTVDQREAVRAQYFDEVVKPTIPEGQGDVIRQQFDSDTKIGFLERITAKGSHLNEAKRGLQNLVKGWQAQYQTAKGTVANADQRAFEESMQAFDAVDKGVPEDELRKQYKGNSAATLASMYARATPEERQQIRAQSQEAAEKSGALRDTSLTLMRQYSEEMKANKGVAPDFTDIKSMNDFTLWLSSRVPSGLVSTLPAMVVTYVTKNPGLGTLVMYPQNLGGQIQQRAQTAEDLAGPHASEADRNKATAGYVEQTLPTSAGVAVGQSALDAMTGVEGQLAKEAVKKGAKEMAVDTVKAVASEGATGMAQEVGSIAGERHLGEQKGDILTEENVKRVINSGADEAAGGLGAAPIMIGAQIGANRSLDQKAKGLRDIAKRLRGEPIDSDAVVDNPSTPGAGGAVMVPPQRGVAGVPIPKAAEREIREKIDPKDVEVLDAGDDGAGKRPALAAPPAPAPLQIENRPTPEPTTGTLRVDSGGNVTQEFKSEGQAASEARQQAQDLGQSPVRVPKMPKRNPLKSARSEYTANRALEDRMKAGWTSPLGKSLREVLAARPRKEEAKQQRRFALFSKRASEAAKHVKDNPKFQKWFGGSKARDKNGPAVYYHGTAADFDQFKPQQAGAIFLSPDPVFAEMFAHQSLDWLKKNISKADPTKLAAVDEQARAMVRKNYEEQDADQETIDYYVDNVRMTDEWLYAMQDAMPNGPSIMPVFVRAERPFDGSDPKQAKRVVDALSKGKGMFTLDSQQWTDDDLMESLDRGDWTVLETKEIQDTLKALGHDGFYVTEGGRKNLAVYNPKQIKSATGNAEFDADNPSIVKSKGSGAGVTSKAVQRIVDSFAKVNKGANKLNVQVYQSTEEAINDAGLSSDDVSGTEGLYFGNDGTIILIADAMTSERRAMEVLLHEMVGHHGVEAVIAAAGPGFARRWLQVLDDVAATMNDGSYVSMQGVATSYGGKRVQAMEVLARMAEKGVEHNLLTKAISIVRDALRALGFNLRMTKSDFITLIGKARQAVLDGNVGVTAETKAWHEGLADLTPEGLDALKSEPAPVWFSQLARSIGALKLKAAQAKDWISAIKNMGGVKREEIEWSGILDWLATREGKVTSDEVQAYLDKNGVEVTETMLGDPVKIVNMVREYVLDNVEAYLLDRVEDGTIEERAALEIAENTLRDVRAANTVLEVGMALNRNFGPDHGNYVLDGAVENNSGAGVETQYGEHGLVLPGGKNYRELLLRLPAKARKAEADARRPSFQSNHWSESNVVAHIRMNERTDADGKKVLFIEEIQSDWAQSGRRRGSEFPRDDVDVSGLGAKLNAVRAKLRNARHEQRLIESDSEFDTYKWDALQRDIGGFNDEEGRLLSELGAVYNATPRGPFVTKTEAWVSLALKRAIRYAVDNDFDRVAFTTGEQQAKRNEGAPGADQNRLFYPAPDLGKVSNRKKGGVEAYPVLQTVTNDLLRKLGGEKMTTFTIKMPPQVSRENREFGYEDRLTAQPYQQPGFEITPQMREVASRGMPLFSKSWSNENATFEVAPGGDAAIKPQWSALPYAERARITMGITGRVVPKLAALFTDSKVKAVEATGGWMGDVNPSVALKMPGATENEAKDIATAIAYVFDQDAGLHVSKQGTQDAIVVTLADGQDGPALYKTLPGNDSEFIGFTSPAEGVMEFLVEDATKSLPKLQAHFGSAKVEIVKRGFTFLGPKDYKALVKSLDKDSRAALDAFREQARALMRLSLSPKRKGTEVSTASVTAKETWLDPMEQRISVGIANIYGVGPDGIDVHAALMEKMPNIRPKQGRTAAETIEAAIEHFRSNLTWLFDRVPAAIRDRSKLWYVGGNRIAGQMSKFYGITKEQAAATIAALSPQRDWFVNVSLARRVLDIWKYQQDFVADDMMDRAARADRTQQSENARAAQLLLADRIRGKKLSEISDPLEAAAWVRAYDDAFNARSYRVISPEGETMGLALNDDGSTAEVQWGSINAIANAVSILRDGSMESISNQLGEGHKVRSFYSNIIDPSDALAATIDTHAVAAATLRPLSADASEVRNAFGGNEKGERGPVNSSIIGTNGTYGIYHEAYVRAAKDRGVLPREMQSITWEALRGLFSAAEKRTNSAPVDQLWNLYHSGKRTLAQVREELLEVADGIADPDWVRSHPELDEAEQAAVDNLGLSGAGRNDGEGSGATPTPGAGRRRPLKSVAASNGGSGPVEYSRRPPAPGSVSVDAWHWSHGQLDTLSGNSYGSGIRGAEAKRLQSAAPEIRKRVYFYVQRDNGTIPRREGGLGPNRHEVRLANLWKSGVSPSIKVEPVGTTQSGIFIRDEAATMNAWEQALLAAGYDGYVDGLSGVAVVLNSDVPVQYVRTAPLASKAAPAPKSAPAAYSGLVDGLFKAGFGWVGRHLTGPAYDYLIRAGSRVVPDKVKHGLVSDFGLEGQYLDAKIDRTAAVNKVLRETKNLLDSLAGLTREQSRIAYLWMNEKPDTELEQSLMSQIPADDRAILRNMKGLIDRLGQDAVKAGLLTQDSYERNKMAYLHRVYAKHVAPNGATLSASARKAAAIRAENFKGRGIRHDVADDMLVQNIDEIKPGDMLDRWEAKSPSGKVTAVKYLKQGAKGPAGYTNAGAWEARFFDKKNKVGLWRDLTKDEREKLGEIEEVRFAFAKTVINGVRDIENARFLGWVAENYATTSAPADKIIGDPAGGYWSTQTFAADEYVKVPDSEVQGTGIKKYGALAGKIIPATIWNDIRNQMARPDGATAAAWDALVRGWKVSKTALSPAVHTNNVMSNFIMADLADVRARDILKALQTIIAAKKGDAAARAVVDRFEDSGADYGSFANIELNQLYIEPLMAELSKVENNELGLLKMSQIVDLAAHGNLVGASKALGAKLSVLKVPFDLMLKAYQSEDSVFRLAKFLRETAAGRSDREAGKMARDAFLDYNINAPWVQAARRSVLPFIAFSYRALPLMLSNAAHKPWKFGKYLAVGSALNAAAYAMLGLSGDDEDRERRMLPDELSGRLLGVFPRLVRMPWNDEHGSPVFLDVRRWVPGGDMIDLNQSQAALPVPSWLSVSGPLSIMMEFFSNKSSFTGRDIVKETDTKTEAALKVTDHLAKAFAPNLPIPIDWPGLDRGLLTTYAGQAILDAGTGRTDAFGRDQSMATALLSSIGVKARVYPEDTMRIQLGQDFRAKQSEIQRNIQGLARELSRGGISRAEFDRRVAREQEKLEKAAQELRKRMQ
jgi:hypothetical protein